MAQEAFAVIREALVHAGKIALGRIVIATRERILARSPAARASWPTPCARTAR